MTNWTNSKNWTFCISGSLILLSACADIVPLSTRMSDAVMAGVKPSKIKTVSYEFVSHVPDGEIPTCRKSSQKTRSTHSLHLHNESSTLKKMIKKYFVMKFNSLEKTSDPKVKIVLKDFWIEEQSQPKSWGKVLGDILLGGHENLFIVANLDLKFEIIKDGDTFSKSVRVSTDTTKTKKIRSILESSSKKSPEPEKTSDESRFATVINDANNKAIIRLNQFLEANEL